MMISIEKLLFFSRQYNNKKISEKSRVEGNILSCSCMLIILSCLNV